MTRRILLHRLAAVTGLWLAAVTARAADTVKVEVALVKATREAAAIDPALKAFARDLASVPYTTFTAVDTGRATVSVGAIHRDTLGQGVEVSVTIGAVTADGATFTVDVTRAGTPPVHMTVTRPWGRAQVVSAGKDGAAALIVPVLVSR
jgi:hypothetical protein